jgi:hypothetical protein
MPVQNSDEPLNTNKPKDLAIPETERDPALFKKATPPIISINNPMLIKNMTPCSPAKNHSWVVIVTLPH